MKFNPLGRTGLQVSELCLGTMTFGTQTDQADGHRQIDMALERGINFLDTAEMYPVNPVRRETAGRTEEIIGNWLAAHPGRRDDVILATKVTGAGSSAIVGKPAISRDRIISAVDASLKRLQTDYIDLYQMHWPNRGSYHFRQYWRFDPSGQSKADTIAHMDEALETFDELIQAGKLRHIGLSNDSAWGTSQWVRIAETRGLPRVASIQNEYSLLCRIFDTDLSEACINEDVGLLAYSPLAAGLLSGKYQGGAVPEGSRMAINGDLGGRKTDRVFPAVDAYARIAEKYGLDLVHMSLAWCCTRPFMASVIFGATTSDQLQVILDGADVELSQEVLDDISEAHKAHAMPF